jgi:hypothetical protein
MVHAKNAVVQELVASTLKNYKIPMVPWVIYNKAKEVADMESGLKAFKETMAKIVGEKLSSRDRRSLGRRFWDAHKDILKSIVHSGWGVHDCASPLRLGGSLGGAARATTDGAHGCES